uniref:Acyl-coenzyme A oxidase N-terminal domain-containing protein n=1 Tax=Ananas comosus var. bracteatus TaxID=296719 RepID=A0A6V7NQU0_ANACO|nr:unnamed protein product [Ananas comosus var. bracteatus]
MNSSDSEELTELTKDFEPSKLYPKKKKTLGNGQAGKFSFARKAKVKKPLAARPRSLVRASSTPQPERHQKTKHHPSRRYALIPGRSSASSPRPRPLCPRCRASGLGERFELPQRSSPLRDLPYFWSTVEQGNVKLAKAALRPGAGNLVNAIMQKLLLLKGMFVPAIKGQGTDEQQQKWIPLVYKLQIIGCYAQTELGHGSNVQGLETTATFDPKTDEFVIHSPTLTSSKVGGLRRDDHLLPAPSPFASPNARSSVAAAAAAAVAAIMSRIPLVPSLLFRLLRLQRQIEVRASRVRAYRRVAEIEDPPLQVEFQNMTGCVAVNDSPIRSSLGLPTRIGGCQDQ